MSHKVLFSLFSVVLLCLLHSGTEAEQFDFPNGHARFGSYDFNAFHDMVRNRRKFPTPIPIPTHFRESPRLIPPEDLDRTTRKTRSVSLDSSFWKIIVFGLFIISMVFTAINYCCCPESDSDVDSIISEPEVHPIVYDLQPPPVTPANILIAYSVNGSATAAVGSGTSIPINNPTNSTVTGQEIPVINSFGIPKTSQNPVDSNDHLPPSYDTIFPNHRNYDNV